MSKIKKKLRVLTIFGTRPEASKMCPVVLEAQANPYIESLLCVTAQHRQMLDQVLETFKVVPDFDLNLMQPDQSLSQSTAAILLNLEMVIKQVEPDWVLVQGDTTTVMAAALLCYYNRVRVGHVEAGLRTGDKWQPFPEEVNRRIAAVVADLHLAPTDHARQNLLREGIADNRIVVTGNPGLDALRLITTQPTPPEVNRILQELKIGPDKKGLVLVTAHRRENFGKPLENICSAIQVLANRYADRFHFIYPVHLNPHVQETVHRLLGDTPNLTLLPPLDYYPMAHLMSRARLILTDSGGIQEEAAGLGIPTLVLREVTERPEGVSAGILRLVGTDPATIVNQTVHLLEDNQAYQAMARAKNPFGDGYAAPKIIQALLDFQP